MTGRGGLAAALALAGSLLAPPSASGSDALYRCRGPEGGLLFTSDASRCSDAEPHEPAGELHRVEPSDPPELRREPRGADSAEAARRRTWRRKRERAEAELARLRERLPALRRARTVCARGGQVRTEDHLGLYRDVSCGALRERLEEAEARAAELRHYLEEGLAEECRRAGCLPGWVRPKD